MDSDKAFLSNIVIRCFSAPLHWTEWSNFPFYSTALLDLDTQIFSLWYKYYLTTQTWHWLVRTGIRFESKQHFICSQHIQKFANFTDPTWVYKTLFTCYYAEYDIFYHFPMCTDLVQCLHWSVSKIAPQSSQNDIFCLWV